MEGEEGGIMEVFANTALHTVSLSLQEIIIWSQCD